MTLSKPLRMSLGIISDVIAKKIVASSVRPHAEAGNVLVLTKPLGTQVAVNAKQWKDQNSERYKKLIKSKQITPEDIDRAYQEAQYNMAHLNKKAATLMRHFNARGATDVTGFGILGHAKNLAKFQQNEVKFVIHNLPVIAKMADIAKLSDRLFKLLQGYSAETSGGLLIAFPREQAASFCRAMEAQDENPAWIIGVVDNGERTALMSQKPRVIEVTTKMT